MGVKYSAMTLTVYLQCSSSGHWFLPPASRPNSAVTCWRRRTRWCEWLPDLVGSSAPPTDSHTHESVGDDELGTTTSATSSPLPLDPDRCSMTITPTLSSWWTEWESSTLDGSPSESLRAAQALATHSRKDWPTSHRETCCTTGR